MVQEHFHLWRRFAVYLTLLAFFLQAINPAMAGPLIDGGAAASISAGRNLTISATTITNAESSITAAGNLTLSGSGTLTNSGVQLQRQEFFEGSSTSSNNGTFNRCIGGACTSFSQPNQTIEARNDIVGDAAATIQAGGALVVAMGNVVNNSQLGSGVMPAGVIVGVSSIGQPAAVATLTAATPTGLGVGGPAAGLVAAPVSLKAPLTPSRFTAAALNAGGGFAALAVKQVSLAQAQANLATVIPGFSALFTPAPPNASALFETRFDFTQLGPFFGSSFFMNAAGYHPEMLMKTLGDAYFDTALITAEIQAQTGRRWLEPQYSDDSSEMKALLEAGASVARDLHLAEGVGLTPAQVASLTQDVVIYVSENVGGQAVLVPALYLAKNAANLATGPASVLAGRNVTIVSGDSLMNTGTIEAGNNLSILVQNNLTNLSGRITAGGDLSLIARTGDIVNQTFTQDWSAASGLMSHTLVGRTALIEAGGNLTAVAGHDVQILGADLGAGKNLALFAGNDLAIGTIGLKDQFSESGPYGWSSRNNLTQVGSQLSAGGSLGITALNSIDIAGSALSAAKNLQVQAGGSLTVESAQDLIDEQSHYSGGNWTKETVNSTHESVTQLRSVLSAGGDVALTAGTGNLVLASSSIEAGGAVDLSAVNGQILLQARLDTLLQDKSRSGSNMLWQSLADKGERVATAQMVEIEHGGALTAEAGHGIVIDYAVLPPPAPAAPAPPPTTSLLQRPPASGTLGMASRPTPLPVRPPPQDPKAASMAALQANLATLSRMPGLGYLSELSGRNDVTLRAVAQAQESWNHQAQGVSGPAAAVIAVAIIAATYGYGTPAAAAELGAATTVTVELAAEAAAEAAFTAAISTLATQATLSLISNQGDIGKTFQDLGSRRDLTQLATSVVTAALTAGLTEGLGLSVPANASFLDKLPTVAERAAVSVGVNTAVGTAINGGNLGQNFLTNLRSGAASVVGELGANEIGQLLNPGGSLNQALGSAAEPLQLLAHAGLGCATGALGGGHCTAGAEGGVVGELAGQALFSSFADSSGAINDPTARQNLANLSQLGAALTAFATHQDVNTAANAGFNAAFNNASTFKQKAAVQVQVKSDLEDQRAAAQAILDDPSASPEEKAQAAATIQSSEKGINRANALINGFTDLATRGTGLPSLSEEIGTLSPDGQSQFRATIGRISGMTLDQLDAFDAQQQQVLTDPTATRDQKRLADMTDTAINGYREQFSAVQDLANRSGLELPANITAGQLSQAMTNATFKGLAQSVPDAEIGILNTGLAVMGSGVQLPGVSLFASPTDAVDLFGRTKGSQLGGVLITAGSVLGGGGLAVLGEAGTLAGGSEFVAAQEAILTERALVPYFPAANGFLGEATQTTLEAGQIIDRFGGSAISRFFSPAGTPAAMRALPPGVADQTLRSFEVLQPFSVESGTVAPAFGQLGLGIQFRSSMTLDELLGQGFLKETTP